MLFLSSFRRSVSLPRALAVALGSAGGTRNFLRPGLLQPPSWGFWASCCVFQFSNCLFLYWIFLSNLIFQYPGYSGACEWHEETVISPFWTIRFLSMMSQMSHLGNLKNHHWGYWQPVQYKFVEVWLNKVRWQGSLYDLIYRWNIHRKIALWSILKTIGLESV